MDLDEILIAIFIPVFFLSFLVWFAVLLRFNLFNPINLIKSFLFETAKFQQKWQTRNDYDALMSKIHQKPAKSKLKTELPSLSIVSNVFLDENKVKKVEIDDKQDLSYLVNYVEKIVVPVGTMSVKRIEKKRRGMIMNREFGGCVNLAFGNDDVDGPDSHLKTFFKQPLVDFRQSQSDFNVKRVIINESLV